MATVRVRSRSDLDAKLARFPSAQLSWPPLATVLVVSFIGSLDFFIVNVALPTIQRDLGASASDLQWMVAGSAMALSICLVPAGALGDRFGNRRILGIGITAFVIASAACGLAQTGGQLAVFRIAQGAAAALMIPQTLALLNAMFVGGARVQAITANALTVGVAAVFGQMLGGILIGLLAHGWRWCFLINVPLGLLVVVALPRLVPRIGGRSPESASVPFDVVGLALMSAAIVTLILPVIEGHALSWPVWTWGCLAVSAALMAAYVQHARRCARDGRQAIIDAALFRHRTFRVGAVMGVLLMLGASSLFFVFALYAQDGRGLTALGAGALFGAMGAGYVLTSFVAPAILARLGRWTIALSGVVNAAGQAVLLVVVTRLSTPTPLPALVVGLVIVGVGMGIVTGPMDAVAMSEVDDLHGGAAASVLAISGEVGSAIGAALVGLVYFATLARTGDVSAAFAHSLVPMLGLQLVIAACAFLLPRLPTTAR